MKLEDRMRLAVSRRASDVISRADVAKMGSPSQVSVALNALQNQGVLLRVGKGRYKKIGRHFDAVAEVAAQNSQTRAGRRLPIPTRNVEDYVQALAARHGVTHVKTYIDAWAESVTRLADDEVHADDVEGLVIALKKARKVTGPEMVQLLASYLREKSGV